MSAPTLYELAAEYRDTLESLADADLPDDEVEATLEALRGALEDKVVQVAAVARHLEAMATSIKEAEDRMATRRKALENRAARIRAYILAQMQTSGIQRVDHPWFTVAVRSNPPAVEVLDEGAIPPQYMVSPPPPPPRPDKRAILDALKHGEEVPGARLTHGARVDIR